MSNKTGNSDINYDDIIWPSKGNKYQLKTTLTSNEFSKVYLAHCHVCKQDVIIKRWNCWNIDVCLFVVWE